MAARVTEGGAVTKPGVENDERVQHIDNAGEFDNALRAAKNRLVVVEYASSRNPGSLRMVELSRTCSDVDFLLVMGDESDAVIALCRRLGADAVPHFNFYKGMEKVHEEEGIGPEQLADDVLYYADSHSAMVQLHSRQTSRSSSGRTRRRQAARARRRTEALRALRQGVPDRGQALAVHGGHISAREVNGDENESCMEFLKDIHKESEFIDS